LSEIDKPKIIRGGRKSKSAAGSAFVFRDGNPVQVEDSPVAADPAPFVRDPEFEAECRRELGADDEIDYAIATDNIGNLIPFKRE
jgi:hypothetical protein